MTSIGQKNVTQQMSSWKSPYRLISACKPRSAKSSSTSRYESEKRKYQPTARRITSGSNWRHLNRPATEGARTISAQLIRPLLQSCNRYRPLHHFLRILFRVALFPVRAFLLHLSKRLCHVFDLI